MKRLVTPSFIVTVLVNLLLGNAILGLLFFDKGEHFAFLAGLLNLVAVFILLFAFSRVKATWKAWHVVLWAVLATVSVPVVAAAVLAAFAAPALPSPIWYTGMSAVFSGMAIGFMIGGPFAVPFLPVNILGLFLFRRHLRRKALSEQGSHISVHG